MVTGVYVILIAKQLFQMRGGPTFADTYVSPAVSLAYEIRW